MKDFFKNAYCGGLLIMLSLLLASCQKAETKYAPSLERAGLMSLVFPGWSDTDSGRRQTVDLSAIATTKDDPGSVQSDVLPMYVVKLDDTHAAMLTEVMPGGEENNVCHACSRVIGTYFFSKDNSGWRLTGRQDAVATSGLEGNIGDTGIVKISDGHYALTSAWGSCWQGHCGEWLVVVGLEKDRASVLTDGIPISAGNNGAFGSCTAIDSPEEEDDLSLHNECIDVQSNWKFQGNRLILNFQGRLRPVDGDRNPLPVQLIKQQAVYEVIEDKLKLVKGTNPVPGI